MGEILFKTSKKKNAKLTRCLSIRKSSSVSREAGLAGNLHTSESGSIGSSLQPTLPSRPLWPRAMGRCRRLPLDFRVRAPGFPLARDRAARSRRLPAANLHPRHGRVQTACSPAGGPTRAGKRCPRDPGCGRAAKRAAPRQPHPPAAR